MYPGRSIWAWGVLALGAGILLLSGPRWRVGSAIPTADGARSIRADGPESLALERSVTRAGASYPSTDVEEALSEPRLIEGDKRWQRSANQRDGSAIVETPGTIVTHTSTLVSIEHGKIGRDGLSSRSWDDRVNEERDALVESPQRDRRSVVARADAHSSYFSLQTRTPDVNELIRLGEPEGGYNEREDARATSLELRNNDRSEEEIAEEAGSGSRSKANDRRRSRTQVAPRSARVARSWEAVTDADDNLRSPTWVLRHVQGSRDADAHFIPSEAPATSESDDNRRAIAAEGNPRSPEGRTSILVSAEGDTADGGARRFAGMQEDQLLFFRDDRERVRSSAMSRAEAIGDRKDWPGEQDREDLAGLGRRGGGRDWFMRTSNRSGNVRGHEEDSLVGRGGVSPVNEESESRDRRSGTPNDTIDNEPANEKANANNEKSSEKSSAFQILDSIIPLDNKRRKVTRGEDSKELMAASNFEWTSRDRRIGDKLAIPKHRSPSLSQETQERRPPRTGRRRNARQYRRTIAASSARRLVADRGIRETIGDWRERYTNYYSPESATPMAYVHIQPAYPAAPPTSRKCVRCMVVYKPCPSQPRPPPRIVLPSYKYHEPAANWRGLKYGE